MQTITRDYIDKNFVCSQGRGTKIICPSCMGNDCWETVDDNGRIHCFNCGENFTIDDGKKDKHGKTVYVELDIPKIRKYYKEAVSSYRDYLTPSHKSFLKDRGFDDVSIETFQIGFCPSGHMNLYDNDIVYDAGLADRRRNSFLGSRIIFPYIANDEITDVRGRTIIGEDPKYKSAYNPSVLRGAVFPFNWDRAEKKAKDTKKLIITEGEIKAAIADMFGYACVALPGMTNWRQMILYHDWQVIVIFDNDADPSNRRAVDKAISKVHTRIPNIKVGTLPLLGQKKMDIDSLLLRKDGFKYFDNVVNSAVDYDFYKKLRRF